MGVLSAWVSSASEDVSLLTHAYFPEFLVVSLLVLLMWTLKRFSAGDHRSR